MPDRFHTLHTPAVAEDLIDPREQKIRRLTARVAELEQTNRRLTQRIGEIQRLAADTLTETAELPEEPERPVEPMDGKEKKPPENRIHAFSWKWRQKKEPAEDSASVVTVEQTGWRKSLNLPAALTIPAAFILLYAFLICGYELLDNFELVIMANYAGQGLFLGLLAYVCIKHTQTTRAAGAAGMLLGGAVLVVLQGSVMPARVMIVSYLAIWLICGLIRWKFGDGKKPAAAAAALCGVIRPVTVAVMTQSWDKLASSMWLIYFVSYALGLFGLTRIRPKGESKKPFWMLFGVVAAAACGLEIYIVTALS